MRRGNSLVLELFIGKCFQRHFLGPARSKDPKEVEIQAHTRYKGLRRGLEDTEQLP